MQADQEVTYTVGIHADVEEGTEVSLMVYDGEWSEVYTLEQEEICGVAPVNSGKYTLWYCFGKFLEGGQTDLRGQIMASVCKDIMLGFGEAMLTDTEAVHGQEWFDMFLAIARSTEKRYREEDLKTYYPGSWLLIKLADSKGIEGKELVPIEELDWEKILKDHLRNE